MDRQVGGGADRVRFAALPFVALPKATADQWLVERALTDTPGDVHYINAFSIALTVSDPAMLRCLTDATANFADGRPIKVLSRFLSTQTIPQNRGPAAFEDVISLGTAYGLRHYLLGSTPATMERLRRAIAQLTPDALVVGSASPPFRALTETEIEAQDAQIAATRPHIVWVGLGTPKQDFEAARLARAGFFAVAVGAAFDFSAGTKKEAPRWMRVLSLEWLYRFAQEPRRLWRRYLVGNVTFLRASWRRR